MLKLIIPTLSVVLLCNSIATAQYFGTQYSTSSSYLQPTQSIQIAQATDTDRLSGQSGMLDDLDTLNALDGPASKGLPLPVTIPLDRIAPLDQPQSFELIGGLDSLASPDMPERLKLPQPADIGKPTVREQSVNVQPEISDGDLDSLDPIAPLQSIAESAPAPFMPLPGPIDFSEAIRQQQHDFTQAAQQQPIAAQFNPSARLPGGTHLNAHPTSNCGYQGVAAGDCVSGQGTLPYRTPILPPPNSFHGHFRSNPCYFDLWENYPAEVAAACAHNREKLAPTKPTSCATCELVAPCPRR